jgi:hypothetical protein
MVSGLFLDQERRVKVGIESVPIHQRTAERHECLVDIGTAVAMDAQAAMWMKPTEGT